MMLAISVGLTTTSSLKVGGLISGVLVIALINTLSFSCSSISTFSIKSSAALGSILSRVSVIKLIPVYISCPVLSW